MTLRLPAALAAFVLLSACGQNGEGTDASSSQTSSDSAPEVQEVRLAPVNEDKMRARIATLSSDDFEGRAPATPGGMKTRAEKTDCAAPSRNH